MAHYTQPRTALRPGTCVTPGEVHSAPRISRKVRGPGFDLLPIVLLPSTDAAPLPHPHPVLGAAPRLSPLACQSAGWSCPRCQNAFRVLSRFQFQAWTRCLCLAASLVPGWPCSCKGGCKQTCHCYVPRGRPALPQREGLPKHRKGVQMLGGQEA